MRCEGRAGKFQSAKVFLQILDMHINILPYFFASLAVFAVKNVFALDSNNILKYFFACLVVFAVENVFAVDSLL